MQRKDLPLWLYRHTARQLLQHTAQLINRLAELGRITRLTKVRAHSCEPLNEAADALAAAAAELDPARAVDLDLDQEAVHFLFKGRWAEWDTSLRDELAQRAAEQCVSRVIRPKRGRAGRRRCRLPCLSRHPGLIIEDRGGWRMEEGGGRRMEVGGGRREEGGGR